MEILFVIILILILTAGVVFIVLHKKKKEVEEPDVTPGTMPESDCCGAHEVCERDLVKVNPDIIEYFDDEDLDKFSNINENEYSDEQIDEFREILYTLKKSEIQNWILSLSRRNIALPTILHDEARMLILE